MIVFSSGGTGFFIQQPDASTATTFRSSTGAALATIATTGNLLVGSSVDNGNRFQVTGSATFSSSGLFSGNLQANGVLTIGNQLVAGTYCLGITPSTTTPIQLQAILAGTGTAPIVLQPSGGNVLINTTTDSGYKLDVNGTGRFTGALTADRVLTVHNTNNSTLVAGSIEIQSFALNNCWIGDNIYFDGVNFKARNTGYVPQIYFQTDGSIAFKTGPTTVSAGGNSNNLVRLTIANSGAATFTGSVDIGNSVAAAVAAPSTHKVAILIGGVQYYLLASNV